MRNKLLFQATACHADILKKAKSTRELSVPQLMGKPARSGLTKINIKVRNTSCSVHKCYKITVNAVFIGVIYLILYNDLEIFT